VGLAICAFDRVRRGKALLLFFCLLLWLPYLVFIGGDLFPAYRHFTAVIVILALAGALTVDLLDERSPRLWQKALLWMTCLAMLGHLIAVQIHDPMNTKARKEVWEWVGRESGRMLKTAFGPMRPLVAVDAAGCLPYFSGLPSLDMMGLNDYHIAHFRRAGYKPGSLGHDLGDGQYVLDRQPDIIIFGGPTGSPYGYFPSGAQMKTIPALKQRYKMVHFAYSPPGKLPMKSVVVWVRREGGKVGIQRSPGRIIIPGYLLTDDPRSTVAELDPRGRIGINTTSTIPLIIKRLEIPPGGWRIKADSSATPNQRLCIYINNKPVPLVNRGQNLTLWITGAKSTSQTFVFKAQEGSVHIRRLILEKMGDKA
jgi:hypothetical protein